MIRLLIDHINEDEGIVCVSLVSSDGGKIVGSDKNGGYSMNGITRKFPVKLALHEGDEYFITDTKTKFFKDQVDELRTDIRKSDNRG